MHFRKASPHRRPASLRAWSRRSIWFLALIVVLSGLATFGATRYVIDEFRASAVRIEREATDTETLKADVVTHAVLLASPATEAQQQQVAMLQAWIRTQFAQTIADQQTSQARTFLEASFAEWEAMVHDARATDDPDDRAALGVEVTAHVPTVLTLLERAGAASRDAVRADLDAAERFRRVAVVVLGSFGLLAIILAVRLARRLDSHVLRRVGVLRDSANHLAAGELDHRVVVDSDDELGELASSFNAMADAIAGSQRSLAREARTDALCGLPNRPAFQAWLDDALAHPQRRATLQAVVMVDLDDFKDVNDALGHAGGDELLRVVAHRLSATMRPGDSVARLGGDEFALLLDDLADAGVAVTVADRIVTTLGVPIDVGGTRVQVGASVGVAMRTSGSTADQLMREADVAMYAAKAKGKNRVEMFDAGLDEVAMRRRQLRHDVGSAVERDQLVLEYQPVFDLASGTVSGLEALVRWQHPIEGLLAPASFIGLAEETGAILGIGTWVLESAALQLDLWRHRYDAPDLWVSVNVSMRQLEEPGFADVVAGVLASTGADPTNLVLEVTESLLADPQGDAASTLSRLRVSGVRIALDDFGTGFSSINYLRQLPLDIMKIDRSFTVDARIDGVGDALLEAVVALARQLELEVIPEGIEDPGQLARLRSMGCCLGQGFLLCRPQRAAMIDTLLAWRVADPGDVRGRTPLVRTTRSR